MELILRLRSDSKISVRGLGESHCRPLVCLEDEKVNVREWIIKRCFQKKVLRDFTSVDHLSPLAVFPCSVFS